MDLTLWASDSWCRAPPVQHIGDWPNSLDCTDLNQCGARRDAELCRLCYKQTNKTFDCMYCSQKLGEDFAKFCGLLRIYEL